MRRPAVLRRIALALVTAATLFNGVDGGAVAHAQDDPEALEVDYLFDGSLLVTATVAAYLIKRVPVEVGGRWNREVFGSLDIGVRDNFSLGAAKLSDITLTTSVAAPIALLLADGLDDGDAETISKRFLIFGQALALGLLPAATSKVIVKRPRPYRYAEGVAAEALRAEKGDDTFRSFYSGHSSTSFGAGVAGSMLAATYIENETARAMIWGTSIALATATANLRVIAGRHYYSDVVIGAVMGGGISYTVVSLHLRDGFYKPSGAEWGGIGAGLALGAITSQLLPFGSGSSSGSAETTSEPMTIAPMPLEGGAGLSLVGVL